MSGSCIEIRELLSPYIDSQVNSAERSLVEDHLQDCSECAHELATLRETVALLRRMPQVATPRSFTLEAPRRQPMALFAFLRAGSALATVAFLVMLTLDVVRSGVLPVGLGGFSASPVATEATRQQQPAAPQTTFGNNAPSPSGSPAEGPQKLQATKQESRSSDQAAGAAAPAPPAAAAPQPQEMRPAAAPQAQGDTSAQADSAPSRPDSEQKAPADSATSSYASEPPSPAGPAAPSNASPGPAQPESALRLVEAAALGLAVASGVGAIWVRRGAGPAISKRRRRS